MMEKIGYRENYQKLNELFPGRATISVKEAATVLDVNIKTVYSAISRRCNPLPSMKITKGKTLIPIAGLARWLAN